MKHKEIIKAWADGEQIQFKCSGSYWQNLPTIEDSYSVFFQDNYDYRVYGVIKEYRVYAFKNFNGEVGTCTVENMSEALVQENEGNFIKWISDWIEYEV